MKENILKVKATIDDLSDKGNKWADRGILIVEGALVIGGMFAVAGMLMSWSAGMVNNEKVMMASFTCFGNAIVIELWRRFRWLFYSLMVIMMLMSGIGYAITAGNEKSEVGRGLLRPAKIVMSAMTNLQDTVKGNDPKGSK